MTARLAKKYAERFSAAALGVPLAIAHAKPSFFTLDAPRQVNVLAHVLKSPHGPHGLGYSPQAARWAARQWVARRELSVRA